VTSGFSAVFPPGLPVGTIMKDNKTHNENFFTLKIKLFTDFSTLSNVQVVVDNQKLELDALTVGEVDAENKKQI
jgi:rod shape-determining protein MreC